MAIRSPICSVLGHVDHGKSSILDKIRGTAIVASEAGAITQAIGASIIPLATVKKVCGNLLEKLKIKFTIPGLLFIDTPGHAAFTSLRRRGGNLADIAILVVDINEGFMPQTTEAIEILKVSKTPFVVAANKIDLVPGWKTQEKGLIENITTQNEKTLEKFEIKLYEVVAKLNELGFNSERFDRVEDYTKQIAIIPCSAKTKEGIPELLMVITGLAQRYLEQGLKIDSEGFAKGTILEVKEDKGLGKTIDVIIYDGTLKVNDTIIIGGLEAPIVTKIRALLEPMPLAEMRDKKAKFKPVKEVFASTGVKISAPGIENAVAGMPLRSCSSSDIENVKAQVQKEVEEVLIETEKDGIVIKADTLGSLEALIKLLKEKDVMIRRASIGNISKKDISEAETNFQKDPLQAIVLGFNVKDESGILNESVKVIINDVIYRLIEDFEKWRAEKMKTLEAGELNLIVRPFKLQLMRGYVFRQSNPAVVGCEILAGKAKAGVHLMNEKGKEITEIKSIQAEKESLTEAEKGKQVAVAMEKVTIGRQLKEGDILYSVIPEEHFKKMKELKKYLKADEIDVLKEIAIIMREQNPVWGI